MSYTTNTIPECKILPTEYPKMTRECKWCGEHIYTAYVALSNGKRRYLPIKEGNNISCIAFHYGHPLE